MFLSFGSLLNHGFLLNRYRSPPSPAPLADARGINSMWIVAISSAAWGPGNFNDDSPWLTQEAVTSVPRDVITFTTLLPERLRGQGLLRIFHLSQPAD
eukprot:768130-Hanusia_phi.AAC.8